MLIVFKLPELSRSCSNRIIKVFQLSQLMIKVNESRYKQCGVTPPFNWQQRDSNQANYIEFRFTLKLVRDMIITYSHTLICWKNYWENIINYWLRKVNIDTQLTKAFRSFSGDLLTTYNALCHDSQILFLLNFYFRNSSWCLRRFYEGL